MAGGKKPQAASTAEEHLQAALVPDWEWPYSLPENWCWTRIGVVGLFERGITFPASAKSLEPREDHIPCLRTANVQEDLEVDDLIYVPIDYMKGNAAKLVRENDIIMSSANSRELVGKTSFVTQVPFPMTFGGFVLNIRAQKIISKFLFYFLRHEFFSGKFMGRSTQTTNIANINTTTLGGYEFPLPPLAEQQRIVDRIERLFAKLDEAKEKAQAALDSFEPRKAAILHKAFTGVLTSQWREEHGVNMESWAKCALSSVATLQTGLMKGKRLEGETLWLPYLRVANVQDGFLNLDEIKEIEVEKNQIQRYALAVGDVLFTEGGDFDKLGRGTVWEGQIENCLHQNHIFVVRPDTSLLNPYFLSYQAGSRYGKDYFLSCSKQTTNLASINSAQLKNFPVLLPSLAEQREIVALIDSLVRKEQHVKEAAEAVLKQINLIKKSILVRAFRGELGTNIPEEESSKELLRQILAGRADVKNTSNTPAKRTLIPADMKALLANSFEKEIVRLLLKSAPKAVPIQKIMAVSSKKFELMEALRKLEQKQLVGKNEANEYLLMR